MNRTITFKAALLLSAAVAMPAAAQNQKPGAMPAAQSQQAAAVADDKIEEIVVTAQSREESSRDTPISLEVVSGDKLQDANIGKAEDLQYLVPNFSMTETGISTNIFIRGIGSGINQAFEQSVGYYIDGVSYPRAQQTRMPFLDVGRIEVLRGPQIILFGKNSVAGALSIVTARPTNTFEGYLNASHEFEENENVAEGALSGPVGDRVRVRVAGRYRGSDGYVRNLTLNRDEPRHRDYTGRGTVEVDVTENLMASLKIEYNKFDSVGRQIEILNERPVAAGPFATRTYSQILVGLGASTSVLNNTLDDQRSSNGDFSNNDQQTYLFNLAWKLGDYELKSSSAFTGLRYKELCDCDYTGANLFTAGLAEKYRQFSQELRLTSPIAEYYDFVAGAYYQSSKHDYSDYIAVLPGSPLITLINLRQAGAGTLLTNTQAARVALVNDKMYAAFGQINFRPMSQFEIQAGGRLSSEDKDGNRTLSVQTAAGGPLPAAQAAAAVVYANVFRITSTNLSALGPTGAAFIGQLGSLPVSAARKETRFSPDLKLVYKPADDLMLYASWSRGYKSGGFDFRANNRGVSPTMAASFEFKDEKAMNYEVGAKTVFADGKAEFNIGAYYTKFDNLQISVFDGTLGFNVGNAASSRSEGIEASARWRLSRYFALSGDLAITDFKFNSFRNGQCYFGQAANVDLDGNGTLDLCDYSGKTNQMVSKSQGTIAAEANYPIVAGYRVDGSVDMFFTSKYFASATLDPDLVQPGYATFNARLGFGPESQMWQIALVGHNLTDKRILLFGGDTPLAGSLFGANSDYAFRGKGRTFGIQARARF
ncbi:MAG: TonB-dependent receptor [Rhodospirillaceae bacterium]|nr:TonB-dependent receptor [Rhodospirillaceae bacterium]